MMDKSIETWIFHLTFTLPLRYLCITLAFGCVHMSISLPTQKGKLVEYELLADTHTLIFTGKVLEFALELATSTCLT